MSRHPRDVEQDAVRNGEGRKERVPLGGFRQKLAVHRVPPGYVARWINDSAGRIQQALAGGYEFCEDETVKAEQAGKNVESDARISRVVDQTTGQKAYLMMIREEMYAEDQRAKKAVDDATEAALRRNAKEGGGVNAEESEPGTRYSRAVIERG